MNKETVYRLLFYTPLAIGGVAHLGYGFLDDYYHSEEVDRIAGVNPPGLESNVIEDAESKVRSFRNNIMDASIEGHWEKIIRLTTDPELPAAFEIAAKVYEHNKVRREIKSAEINQILGFRIGRAERNYNWKLGGIFSLEILSTVGFFDLLRKLTSRR